jgi:hypothetical protein
VIASGTGQLLPGWPEIGAGCVLIGAALLIYFINRQAGRVLGTRWPWLKASQRIGAAFFIVLGIVLVVVGIVHLLWR